MTHTFPPATNPLVLDPNVPERLAQVLEDLGITASTLRPLTGGYSHAAWYVRSAEGAQYVLRFSEAGTAATEAALLRHIAAEVGGAVPVTVTVPQVIASGADYTVLRYIEGQTLAELLHQHWGNSGAEQTPSPDLTPLAADLGRILATLSNVQFARPGFFTDEKLTLTQEAPWSQQLLSFCTAQMAASNRFTSTECARWQQICQRQQPNVALIDHVSTLVHSDFNPKNILVQQTADGTGWHIAALIDWEFAHAGSPLADVGNFCRFGDDYPPGFLRAFLDGYAAAVADQGGTLPDHWQQTARALDLFALSDLATRAEGHAVGDRAVALIRQWVNNGIEPLI